MSHSLHPATPNDPTTGLRRWWGAVWLLPLLTVVLNLVAIGWLYQSQRFAVTVASLTAAWLMALVAVVPPLVRPGPASALSAAMGLQLAAIAAVAFTPAARYPLLVAAPVTEWSGGLVLRLLNMALFGPTLLWFTQVFPEERSDWLSRLAHPLLWLAVTGGLLAPAFVGIRLPLDANIAVGFLLTVLFIGAGTLRLARSAQRRPEARLLLFSALLAEAYSLVRPIWFVLTGISLPYEPTPFAQLILPIGITYTILRHNLFDIDPTARRTLAYAGVSLILLLVYLALSAGLTLLLALIVPDWRGLATLAGLFIAAILFTPLQRALQGAVDRLFYPERRQFGEALAACSRQLNQVLSTGEVTHLLTHRLPAAIAAHWAELLPAGVTPHRPADECALGWHGPLAAGSRELGCFWLGPRRTALPYTTGEEQQLQRLMRQAALALAYGETLAEVQGLNEELEERVAARTAQLVAQQRALAVVDERQRVARELHDSVSQTLFSINLGLGAIRKMVQQAPLAAEQALAEQETAARQALGDMRTLLMQLRTAEPPPAPSHLGTEESVDLIGRLHELAEAMYRRQGLAVSVAAPAQLLLPAAVAATLALVVREALHNVYKHAGVSHASLCVQADGEMITLLVEDGGNGAAAEAAGAFGIRGMHERMTAIGGCVAVESRPGEGTRVRATLPRHQQSAQQGNP